MGAAVADGMRARGARCGARTRAARRDDRQLQLEVEACSPPDSRFHLQIGFHRGRELAADREAEAGLREELAAPARLFTERLEQRGDLVGRNPRPESRTANSMRVLSAPPISCATIST